MITLIDGIYIGAAKPESGGGGGSQTPAEYAIDSNDNMVLTSANMTPSINATENEWLQIVTQPWNNGTATIAEQTLVMKPYAEGGNLINYADDGSAVDLKLFALHPDGQSHEMLVNFVRPNLTADGTLGGAEFACAADSVVDANRPAWKAFDGVTEMTSIYTDMWHSGSGQPHWLEFYNPNPLVVNTIRIFNATDTIVPWEWKFQYSDNGTDWTDCASGTNTDWVENSEWSFNVNDSGEHKYYRFYTTSAHGDTDSYTGITEMQIVGVEHKTLVSNQYKYVLATSDSFTLPTGFDSKVQVAELSIPEHTDFIGE